MKIKSVHNEIFIFDSSKMLKVENKHFKRVLVFITEIVAIFIYAYPAGIIAINLAPDQTIPCGAI